MQGSCDQAFKSVQAALEANLESGEELGASIVINLDGATLPPTGEHSGPPIAFMKDIEKLADFNTWGNVPFVHPDYEYINKQYLRQTGEE